MGGHGRSELIRRDEHHNRRPGVVEPRTALPVRRPQRSPGACAGLHVK